MKKIVLSLASIALLVSCGGESTNNDASKVPTKDSSAVSTPVLEKICKKGYDKEEQNGLLEAWQWQSWQQLSTIKSTNHIITKIFAGSMHCCLMFWCSHGSSTI